MYVQPNFPASVWDGAAGRRVSREETLEPDYADWDRATAELLSLQAVRKPSVTINVAGTTVKSVTVTVMRGIEPLPGRVVEVYLSDEASGSGVSEESPDSVDVVSGVVLNPYTNHWLVETDARGQVVVSIEESGAMELFPVVLYDERKTVGPAITFTAE